MTKMFLNFLRDKFCCQIFGCQKTVCFQDSSLLKKPKTVPSTVFYDVIQDFIFSKDLIFVSSNKVLKCNFYCGILLPKAF